MMMHRTDKEQKEQEEPCSTTSYAEKTDCDLEAIDVKRSS